MYAPIDNASIFIRPSTQLEKYIKTIKSNEAPQGIRDFLSNKPEDMKRQTRDLDTMLSSEDRKFLKELSDSESEEGFIAEGRRTNKNAKLVNLEDVQWVYNYMTKENEKTGEKRYFHDLFQGSEIVLPKNEEVERNPELEKRCQMLRAQQDNLRYQAMTKNVDNTRRKLPEDTIAYQLKQINRHMIAIAQFIMSVAAGFAFGFIGIELLVGSLDFGFRLLLGIICALVIALAELYFLAKKLNEELIIETQMDANAKPKTN